MNAVESVVINDLDWIFRDQPLVDVGVDAVIEKCEKGNPEGKFLAAQIKAGEGNFKVGKKFLTYYVSNVHYHYWLGLNLPIILIGYIPRSNICHWEVVGPRTLKRAGKGWKIKIPLSNILNDARARLEALLVSSDAEGIYSEIYKIDFDSEFSENYIVLAESTQVVKKINELIADLGTHFKASRETIDSLSSQGLTELDGKMKGVVKQQAKRINSMASRLSTETAIFARSFAEEFYIVERLVYTARENKIRGVDALTEQICMMPARLDEKNELIGDLQAIAARGTKGYPPMQKALNDLSDAFLLLNSEFKTARELSRSLADSTEEQDDDA